MSLPAIGFGLMSLSAFYGPVENEEERFKVHEDLKPVSRMSRQTFIIWVPDAAIEERCTFRDSADRYGDSEDLVGK
jgi:aryl-alcohol dehydrogenase-like predicted oxidoreductase